MTVAGLWIEVCFAIPAIPALGEGYDVFVVTDACDSVSPNNIGRLLWSMDPDIESIVETSTYSSF